MTRWEIEDNLTDLELEAERLSGELRGAGRIGDTRGMLHTFNEISDVNQEISFLEALLHEWYSWSGMKWKFLERLKLSKEKDEAN